MEEESRDTESTETPVKANKALSSAWTAAAAAAYFTVVLNLAFWRLVLTTLDMSAGGSAAFLVSMPAVLFLLFHVVFSLILWPYFGKAVLAALLVLSSAANYFMYTLNVRIDSEMLRNVFEARPHEAMEMVTLGGACWVLFLGILPAVLLILLPVRYRPFRREFLRRAGHIAVSLTVVAVMGVFFYKDYSAAGRNNKQAVRLINPFNYISPPAVCTRRIFGKTGRLPSLTRTLITCRTRTRTSPSSLSSWEKRPGR